jgi:carbamoyl-phosphate synthase small subunit
MRGTSTAGTLLLKDGTVFRGLAAGARTTNVGEVVFNTSLTGYPEVVTDASYCGQIVAMTYPLIGNYGITREDFESSRPFLSGFVVRRLAGLRSNYRAEGDLAPYLAETDVPCLSEIDTRKLTRCIRKHGALMGIIDTTGQPVEALQEQLGSAPPFEGRDLVREVTSEGIEVLEPVAPDEFLLEGEGVPLVKGPRSIGIIDCGVKANISRSLARSGCTVTIYPATTPADVIAKANHDGLCFSNGPGDPSAVPYVAETAKALIGTLPILGICLGHQMLGLALGATTYKLPFGHHGANHPVHDLLLDKVSITTQNHGFAVDADSLPQSAEATHINLNDDTLEGFRVADRQVLAVQFHPEAAPGPHDALSVFTEFLAMTGALATA